MTMFFAPASHSPVSDAVIAGVPPRAANDNLAGDALDGDHLLHAALRHFAEHGLSAARRAGDNARAAFAAGDDRTCRHWMAICRTLDRRLAIRTALSLGLAAEG